MKSLFCFTSCCVLAALSTLAFAQQPVQPEDAFRTDLAAKAAAADKTHDMVVQGQDGYMFFVPELRHVSVGKFWGEDAKKVSQATQPQFSDPLPAILDFKAQLDKVGVNLLLVPVPPKSVVFADKIAGSVPTPQDEEILPRLDSAHQEFYKLLREKGVQVLDLTDAFISDRGLNAHDGITLDKIAHFPTYLRQDTHWSPTGISIASYLIKEAIKDTLPAATSKFTAPGRTLTIKGDLWDALPPEAKRPPQESVLAHSVTGTTTSRKSPVLLLGDSHTLVFHEGGDMHAKGAGLVDYLAQQLGMPIDLIGVRGSGATPARVSLLRLARADANYLKNKKWIIWCFSAREFTESAGWQKVPVVK